MTIQDETEALLALSDGLSQRDLAEAMGAASGPLAPALEALGAVAVMGEQDGRGVLIYSLPEDHKARGDVMAARDKIRELLEAHPAQRLDAAEVVAKTGIPEGTARGVLSRGALEGLWQKHEPGEGRRTVTYSAAKSVERFVAAVEKFRSAAAEDGGDGFGGLAVREVAMETDRQMMGDAKAFPSLEDISGGALAKAIADHYARPSDGEYRQIPEGATLAVDTKRRPESSALDELCEVQREIGRLQARAEELRARIAG